MRFHGPPPAEPDDPARRMVRYHGEWLGRALRGRIRTRRIPVRRVAEGGFSPLLARPGGRALAEHWWMMTLEAIGS